MSVFTHTPGAKIYRSFIPQKGRKILDANFGKLYPVLHKFILPADIIKINCDMLIRTMPMLAPSLTRMNARVRFFYCPLRLLDDRTEQIITGSKNGKLITTALPQFDDLIETCNTATVQKWSFMDFFGIPVGLNVGTGKGGDWSPAAYWYKAYVRCWYDYYRDENFDGDGDFEHMWSGLKNLAYHSGSILSTRLKKDYFTSCLPFIMKGATPTFSANPLITGVADVKTGASQSSLYLNPNGTISPAPSSQETLAVFGNELQSEGVTFNAAELRILFAQTRLFQMLASTGSRYVEYLESLFGTAPADGTLQRPLYLGGFKQPIVVTDIAQTAEDPKNSSTNYPVGTLRGKGISAGSSSIKTFYAKEFGVLLGLLDISPDIQYTQGISREYTYKSRFDFYNPAFQNLSEQEVRNAEIYAANDGKNNEVFGFNPIYQELRCSNELVVGDMRDTLSYWTQAIHFTERPNLNGTFLDTYNYKNSFTRPFTVIEGANPFIIDFAYKIDFYRPMVKYATGCLIDHL